jgi:hypothetical protein
MALCLRQTGLIHHFIPVFQECEFMTDDPARKVSESIVKSSCAWASDQGWGYEGDFDLCKCGGQKGETK